MEIEVRKYEEGYREQWEDFIERSANGTFLQRRSFIEYHGDRFEDASLMVWEGEELLSVFPAHRVGDQIFSHQGLSFGGWIIRVGLNEITVEKIISETLELFKSKGIEKVSVTPIPEFYYTQVLSESVYRHNGFSSASSSPTYVISLPNTIKNKGRKWALKKANKNAIRIEEGEVDQDFWEKLLVPQHLYQMGKLPVHSWEEIKTLSLAHKGRIRLLSAYLEGKRVGGIVLFKHSKVIRLQYIAVNKEGREKSVMDLMMDYLMQIPQTQYLDLGGVVDPRTKEPNFGLVYWKESFGSVPKIVHSYQKQLT